MLTYSQFSILNNLRTNPSLSQRQLAELSHLSLGTINSTIKELQSMELLNLDCCITKKGLTALLPYKVDNAVIMAAGLSSRFAPISYEKPKGVLSVRGEVLIERQIRQLREAGIDEIIVVVGYKKEEFFYLEDEFDVEIVINNEYSKRNNNSTIHKVINRLGNTYICSSDDYFTENPFEEYVFQSYYSAVYCEGPTSEWCIKTKGKNDLIVDATIGGENSWVMLGHAYWDRSFSKNFCRILNDIYDKPETYDKLWEKIFIENIKELPMVMRKYPSDVIWEFDNLDELRVFDPSFIDNIESHILDNICTTLSCNRADIQNIIPIKQGLTNLSFRFSIADDEYVYRHPGPGSDKITNRKAEAYAEEIVSEAGIDNTFIFEDPETGWKISHYVSDFRNLDYHNWEDVELAMQLARKLHSLDADCNYDFDIHQDTLNTLKLLNASHRAEFKDFDELFNNAELLNDLAMQHCAKRVLCHNDFYPPNFLIKPNREVELIDWEYAGMSDFASDIAVFICCCEDYSYDDALKIYELYFGRQLTSEELFHFVAFSCVVAFHWLIWAMYQDEYSEPVGELLYYFYRYTKMFSREAIKLAKALNYID